MNKLFGYEIKNLVGNWYVLAWGVVFPVFALEVMPRIFMEQIPDMYREETLTGLFIGYAVIMPLSIIFIGFAVSLAQELEQNILERIRLFGHKNSAIFGAKMLAHFLYLTGAITIYTVIIALSYKLDPPTLKGALLTLLSLYLFSAILFILSYAIATLIKKANAVNGLTMMVFMLIFFLSGLFGLPVDKFPPFFRGISKLLPTYYLGNEFYNVWVSRPYNYAPFIQSMILLAAVSGLLFFWSMYRERRALV